MKKTQGFTLVEITIVVGFIASMAFCVGSHVHKPIQKAKEEIVDQKANMLNERIAIYKNLIGPIPSGVNSSAGAIDILAAAKLIRRGQAFENLQTEGSGNDIIFIAKNSARDNDQITAAFKSNNWQEAELSNEVWVVGTNPIPPLNTQEFSQTRRPWNYRTLQQAANILFH